MTGWPQNAYVGQRVVSITAEWVEPATGKDATDLCPSLDEVATIRSIHVWEKFICFELDEYSRSIGFAAVGFRPVKDTTAAVEKIKRNALRPSLPAGEPVA